MNDFELVDRLLNNWSFVIADSELVDNLRKRAEIRRTAKDRKSVEEGKPDRLSALLEEAAERIKWLNDELQDVHKFYTGIR